MLNNLNGKSSDDMTSIINKCKSYVSSSTQMTHYSSWLPITTATQKFVCDVLFLICCFYHTVKIWEVTVNQLVTPPPL